MRSSQLFFTRPTLFPRSFSSENKSYPNLEQSIHQIRQTSSLSFAWITPLALNKGMEGSILARLLNTPGINLIGVRMYAPSADFIDQYIQIHKDLYTHPFGPFMEYLEGIKPEKDQARGYPNHIMLLVFEGEQCRQKILNVIGDELPDPRKPDVGKHIRGAYGFHRRNPVTDEVTNFEPALVTAHTGAANAAYLRLFSQYASQDGGNLIPNDDWSQCGMVMLKPDLFERPSSRPGHIMDSLSSTGLQLIGAKLFSMSVNDATNFYGFLAPIFAKKLAPQVEATLRAKLDGVFNFKVSDSEFEVMTALLKEKHARAEVDAIIHYITGVYPRPNMSEAERQKRGPARCLALVYQGPHAIDTIREKLGATDPKGAADGTIRSDFGRDVMRNGCHASDSMESMHRERHIIGLQSKRWVDQWYTQNPSQRKPPIVSAIIDTWLKIDPTASEFEEPSDIPWLKDVDTGK